MNSGTASVLISALSHATSSEMAASAVIVIPSGSRRHPTPHPASAQ